MSDAGDPGAGPEAGDLAEGVRRLESTLAGTRLNAARAMRDLHAAMARDLAAAEKRAGRAERRLARAQERAREARERARKAERRVRRLRQRVDALTGSDDRPRGLGRAFGALARLRPKSPEQTPRKV